MAHQISDRLKTIVFWVVCFLLVSYGVHRDDFIGKVFIFGGGFLAGLGFGKWIWQWEPNVVDHSGEE